MVHEYKESVIVDVTWQVVRGNRSMSIIPMGNVREKKDRMKGWGTVDCLSVRSSGVYEAHDMRKEDRLRLELSKVLKKGDSKG